LVLRNHWTLGQVKRGRIDHAKAGEQLSIKVVQRPISGHFRRDIGGST
jgi:hypothetical protein